MFHVFPILCNCLVPFPHVPEFLHRAFIPQCIYSPHLSLYPCKFRFSGFVFIPVTNILPWLPDICLVPVSCSSDLFPVLRSIPVSLVKCCFGLFVILLFNICYPSSFSFQSGVFFLIRLSDFLVLTSFVISDFLASDLCLFVDYDSCLSLNKSLFTPLCIWVPSFTFTSHSLTDMTWLKIICKITVTPCGKNCIYFLLKLSIGRH